jgi:hypothetical protein
MARSLIIYVKLNSGVRGMTASHSKYLNLVLSTCMHSPVSSPFAGAWPDRQPLSMAANCNGLRSVLQLSDDDSTSITKLEERKRKQEKMANTSCWFLSAQTGAIDEKGQA